MAYLSPSGQEAPIFAALVLERIVSRANKSLSDLDLRGGGGAIKVKSQIERTRSRTVEVSCCLRGGGVETGSFSPERKGAFKIPNKVSQGYHQTPQKDLPGAEG